MRTPTALAVALSASITLAFSAEPAIGVAAAAGYLRLDQSQVYGNATLFNGSLVETGPTYADLSLKPSATLRLASESAGRVYSDRFVLRKGQAELISGADYRLESLGFQARSAAPDSLLRIDLAASDRLRVAALRGAASVFDSHGLLLARVTPGNAIELSPRAGASAPTSINGVLLLKDGKFLLTDNTIHLTFELVGDKLLPFVNKCVDVTGSIEPGATPAAGAAHLLHVLTIAGCQNPPPAAAAKGLSTTTKVIIGGAIIAAAATGTAIAVTRGGKPAASRQ